MGLAIAAASAILPAMRPTPRFLIVLLLLFGTAQVLGCTTRRGGGGGGGDDDDAAGDDDDAVGDDDDAVGGVPILGNGSNSLSGLDLERTVDGDSGLDVPRDLAFHPQRDELWIVNRGDNSTSIVFEPGSSSQEVLKRGNTSGSQHFLAQPSSIAFAGDGTFATVHETDDLTQGQGGTPADFMGPTLWTSDLDLYDGGHGGHLDMLHNSPNGMGIAWQDDRTFWVFDGYHDSLTRYFFNDDHGPGGSDHTDGEIERHAEGQVRWVEDVPSHMVWDDNDDVLYVADTGNNRVAVYDPSGASDSGNISPNYDGAARQEYWDGGSITTVVDGDDIDGMTSPSGLELWNGMLFVSDHDSGRIFAFDLDGDLLDWLDTERGEGVMGLTFDASGALWFIDGEADRVYRLAATD